MLYLSPTLSFFTSAVISAFDRVSLCSGFQLLRKSSTFNHNGYTKVAFQLENLDFENRQIEYKL